jgi:Transposase IS66 family
MPTRNCANRLPAGYGLGDDPRLLLGAPCPPPTSPREDLDAPGIPSVSTMLSDHSKPNGEMNTADSQNCLPGERWERNSAYDETPVPVLDPGRGRTKTGCFRSMARDDRPFGGTDPPAVAYTYARGRGALHLHTLLRDYRGILQCDGYALYKQRPDDAITLAFCWAHVRRGFFEIARKGNAPICHCALLRLTGQLPKMKQRTTLLQKALNVIHGGSSLRKVQQSTGQPHLNSFVIRR